MDVLFGLSKVSGGLVFLFLVCIIIIVSYYGPRLTAYLYLIRKPSDLIYVRRLHKLRKYIQKAKVGLSAAKEYIDSLENANMHRSHLMEIHIFSENIINLNDKLLAMHQLTLPYLDESIKNSISISLIQTKAFVNIINTLPKFKLV